MTDSPAYTPIGADAIAAIRAAVGQDGVSNAPEKLSECSRDASDTTVQPDLVPELVVEAKCTEDVAALLKLANRLRFPVTPRGGGTGLAGGALPARGGVVLSLARMDSVRIDERNLVAVAGPGALTAAVRNEARAKGLFYPPDPASLATSTIGGNAATNAGGPACLKYGVTRHYVLGIEAVLPSGEIVRAGARTRKGVVGYDLAGLLVGSEGTLGIITELTLKLIPHPETSGSLVAVFPDMASAMRGVNRVLTGGVLPSALEFLDHRCLALIGDLLPFGQLPATASLLLVEADGTADGVARDLADAGRLLRETGAAHLLTAPDEEARQGMWETRRQVSLRIHDSAGLYIPEDVAVPLGCIDELAARLPEYEKRFGAAIYAFGHAGDGNIHLNFTAASPDDRPRLEACIREILALVVAMDGTISGEHGIGLAKKPFLDIELSPESIRLQRELKRLFDPNLILNPGKIF